MGSESWDQWVPFRKDAKTSFDAAYKAALKERGLSDVSEAFSEAEEAVEFCSVLDIYGFAKKKALCKCVELSPAACAKLVGTDKPTRADIKLANTAIFSSLERGERLCIVVWAKGKPTEVYFAGQTVD